MRETDDIALLSEYTERNSEQAFTTLVARHVDLVYSVAMRHVGKPHYAQEITQAVFVILAKKARRLSRRTVLSGWLYHTARLTAANFRRTEMRRARREQMAGRQSGLNETEADDWSHIAPLLDPAMAELSEKDHNAIVLRFFENKSLKAVGVALGTTEDAAKMRVHRALEKLRRFFLNRGVTLSGAGIAGLISANAVHACPAGLTASVSAAGLGKTAVSGSVAVFVKATLQKLFWADLQFPVLCALGVLLGAGTLIVYQQYNASDLTFSSHRIVRVAPSSGVRPAAGAQTIRIKLLGTDGLAYELVHLDGGQSQTNRGVLPDEVSFIADVFTASIHVQGSGEFGFEVFRNDFMHGAQGLGPLSGDLFISISMRGSQEISITSKKK
jgi:RNA polymerase sigma factor (sigma-70 family)